jgi:hypothetical protein
VPGKYWLAIAVCLAVIMAVGLMLASRLGSIPGHEPKVAAEPAEPAIPEPGFGNQVAELPDVRPPGEPEVDCWRSDDRINCRTDAAPSVASAYEEALATLFEADFVYNRVDEMWHGTPADVVLKLVPKHLPSPLISEALEGERKRGQVKVSPDVSAELTGSAGLDVSPLEISRKRFSLSAPTSWQWRVLATKPGDRNLLTLTIYAHFDQGPPYTVAVYEDRIDVRVGMFQRAKGLVAEIQPLWAFAAAAVPTVWGAVVWLRHRRRREGGPALPGRE